MYEMTSASRLGFSSRRSPLGADWMLLLVMLVFVMSAVPHIVPLLSSDQAQHYGDNFAEMPLIVVTLIALRMSRLRSETAREQRFWRLSFVAFSCWFAFWILYLFVPQDPTSWPVELTADLFSLLYYLCFVLAVSSYPHLDGNQHGSRRIGRLEITATALFFLGLLLYFVIIPGRIAPDRYGSHVPSLLMYVILDLLLALGFAWLTRIAGSRPWRRTYWWMGVGFALSFIANLSELLIYLEVVPRVGDVGVLGILWLAPYVPFVVATRQAVVTKPPHSATSAVGLSPISETEGHRALLVVYTAAFPLIHLGLYMTGITEPSIQQPREAVVFLTVVMLGALAIAAHRTLEAERREAETRIQAQSAHLRTLSDKLASAQEIERQQLARELHDDIGGELTGLRLSLGAIREHSGHEERLAIAQVESGFAVLVNRINELSLMLRPTMLNEQGLIPALEWLTERFAAQSGLRIEFEKRCEVDDMSPETRTAAYRIVQEALTNVAKHAEVSEAKVLLRADRDAFYIDVVDRGVGFDTQCDAVADRYGTDGMRERAQAVGGTLEVHSQSGIGTRVAAILPRGA